MKKLLVAIDENIHREFKKKAFLDNKTMSFVVRDAIEKYVRQ